MRNIDITDGTDIFGGFRDDRTKRHDRDQAEESALPDPVFLRPAGAVPAGSVGRHGTGSDLLLFLRDGVFRIMRGEGQIK